MKFSAQRALVFAAAFGPLLLASVHVNAQAGAPAAAAPANDANVPSSATVDPAVLVELNKIEPFDKGCRAYLVVNNPNDTSYQTFKVELVVFQPDAVIARRFALDLAPVRAQKKSVKLFDMENISCDKVGSFLINDVIECNTDAGPADNCLQRLKPTTLSTVGLMK